MFHRCPHCDVVLLEEEWQTGVCVCCDRPFGGEVPAALPPTESAPTVPPAPPKRKIGVAWLRGAVLAALALAALGIWHSTQPAKRPGPHEQDERAGIEHDASPDTREAKDARTGRENKQEPKRDPDLLTKPPRQSTEPGKPPETTTGEKPQTIDKDKAVAFAVEILTATDILTAKYYRELDEDELTAWAIRGLFQGVRESIPPALDQRMQKKSPGEVLQRLDLLVDAREMLGARKELVAPRDADLALQSIFRRLDPHTTLLDPDAMTRLSLVQNRGGVGELGLIVRRQPQGGAVEVVTPDRDGPAYRAGLRAGDVITRVRLLDGPDGKPLASPEDVAPGTLADEKGGHVSWGPLGSRVEVTVRHPDSELPRAHSLARSRVKKEKLLGIQRRSDDSWDHLLDLRTGIYYVRIADFHGPETARELDLLLKGFAQPKLKGLILDLRFTGSGLIQTAFDVADLFVPNGLIVEFRSRNLLNGKGRWMSKGKGSHTGIPIACLINAEAGTCTEIVAAALQDHKRARIVGERTSGKASAQNYFPTGRGTLRITTSCAYRPSGKPLDRSLSLDNPLGEYGVTPDTTFDVLLSAEERSALRERFDASVRLYRRAPANSGEGAFRDRQLQKALESLQCEAE